MFYNAQLPPGPKLLLVCKTSSTSSAVAAADAGREVGGNNGLQDVEVADANGSGEERLKALFLVKRCTTFLGLSPQPVDRINV
jgi:hypothetical protein